MSRKRAIRRKEGPGREGWFGMRAVGVGLIALVMVGAFLAGYYLSGAKESAVVGPGPLLEVLSPANGERVNESVTSVTVRGVTDAGEVLVSGEPVRISNGTFEKEVLLVPGENHITIEARGRGGVTRMTVTVIRGIYPLTVVDDMGRTVTIPAEPQRIVSLAPSNTEVLFAVGAGEKVVGVTDYDDYPPEARDREKVGDFFNPNVEKVMNLTPDLVVAYYGQRQAVLQIEGLGVDVLVMHPQTIEDVFRGIRLIGLVTHLQERAESLASSLETRLNAVLTNTSGLNDSERPRVYYELWGGPFYTAGPGSFVDDLIRKAGGVNIASSAGSEWPVLSEEFILSADPQVIITTTMSGSTPEQIKARPGWGVIDAVKNDSIYVVDGNLLERPGPRLIDGLEMLYGLFQKFHGLRLAEPDASHTPTECPGTG